MRANNCPYCDGKVLRHIRHGGVYWFCSSCRQRVPFSSGHSHSVGNALFYK